MNPGLVDSGVQQCAANCAGAQGGPAGSSGIAGTAGASAGGSGGSGGLPAAGAGAGGVAGSSGTAGVAGVSGGGQGGDVADGGPDESDASILDGGVGADGSVIPGGENYCDTQPPKTLPFALATGGYASSAWFPATGPDDMTMIDCSDLSPLADAGTGFDAGAEIDGGSLNHCYGVSYEQISPSGFAGMNWVPNVAQNTACFVGAGAVEFWARGTPGAVVYFQAHGTVLYATLSASWRRYRISIAGDFNTTGVSVAFTVAFDSFDGEGPYVVYYADPTYVE